MIQKSSSFFSLLLPAAVFAVCIFMLTAWMQPQQERDILKRVPSGKGPAVPEDDKNVERNRGTLIQGTGKPAQDNGLWNQFRGPNRNGVASDTGLLRAFPEKGPKVFWRKKLGPRCNWLKSWVTANG